MGSSDARFDPATALRAVAAAGARLGITTLPGSSAGRPRISLRDHEKYVSLSMEFRCNLKCVHCMIGNTMDRLIPTSDDTFAKVLREQQEHNRWEGVVLTGSEITLRKDLPELVKRARSAGFSRVRIQTHGIHFANTGFAQKLLDAGINEYFISVAGSDARTHDRITAVPEAWDKMMKGMEFLDCHDHVRLLTNTVVTKLSYSLLPEIVERLSHLRRLVQMEFWNYWPMAENDVKDLCASHTEILPYLRAAIFRARELDRFIEVKNFPECMLAELGDALVNAQPLLIIDPEFWKEFDRNGFYQCVHRDRCSSTECLGLNTAYIGKYGQETDLLHPIIL